MAVQRVPIEDGTGSQSSSSKRVPLAALVFNKKHWPRQSLDEKRVKEFADLYKDEPDRLPPLDVALISWPPRKEDFEACTCELCQKREKSLPKDAPRYEVSEGWHRGHALLKLKSKDAPVVMLPSGTDVFQHALTISAEASKPLTLEEKRAVVRRLIEERNKKKNNLSDRQIAKLSGMSHTHVSNQLSWVNRKLSAGLDAGKKLLAPGDASSSADIEWQRSVQMAVVRILLDRRSAQITVEDMMEAWDEYPDLRPIAQRLSTVMYQSVKQSVAREQERKATLEAAIGTDPLQKYRQGQG